jgi:xanthine dehydrogenase accessory factor
MKAAILERLLAAQSRRRPVAVVTRLADGAQCFVDDQEHWGDLTLAEAVAAELPQLILADRSGPCAADPALFARVYAPPPRLLVIGAVHIAQALAPMAALAGFDVTVIDPRRAFASDQRFPGVTLSDEWPDEAMQRLVPDLTTAVVTLAHDPKIDDPALEIALRSPAFYIGSLGSKKTHASRLERLAELGLAEAAKRIHAPVGLDLGGRSPAEIAVAILAQILQRRYGKS